MKKVILLLFMAAVFCGKADAQKGMQGVGVNAGVVATEQVSIGGGFKYQYNLSNYVRIEPSLTYYVPDNGGYTGSALVNLDIFFRKPQAWRPYLFIGVGYVTSQYESYDRYYDEEEDSGFGINAGLGWDWRISNNWSIQTGVGILQGFGEYFDETGLKVNIGISYNF